MTATTHPTPTMIILYVDVPPASAAFYEKLFGIAPVELSATFAMFILPQGLVFGLWSRHTVEPAAAGTGGMGGGGELAIRLDTADAVDALHAQWQALGLTMLQAPVELDFGRTFVATDPDGHRIRAFHPSA